MVGGIHPDLPFSYYVEMLQKVQESVPEVSLKAFTAAEYDYFAQLEGVSVREILKTLHQAGLRFIPGGGAENFSQRLRKNMRPQHGTIIAPCCTP